MSGENSSTKRERSVQIEPHITAAQIRAGRALVDWSREKLSMESGLSIRTLTRIETGQMTGKPRTLKLIRHALEASGVHFVAANRINRAGVRMDGDEGRMMARNIAPDKRLKILKMRTDNPDLSVGAISLALRISEKTVNAVLREEMKKPPAPKE